MTTTETDTTYRYARLRIKYFDIRVPAVIVGRAAYFPARSLCKAMGLSFRAQQRRLNTDPRLLAHERDLPVPTIKGTRDTKCIHREGAAIWFALIDPAKCTIATTRERLDKFQAELFAAADRFLFGDTSDVTYDEATQSAKPIIGSLSVGDCPRCGLALKLEYTETGAHLAPDEEQE